MNFNGRKLIRMPLKSKSWDIHKLIIPLCIEKIEKWSHHALFDTRRTRKPFVLLGGLIKRINICIERFPDRVNLVRSLSSVHSRVI